MVPDIPAVWCSFAVVKRTFVLLVFSLNSLIFTHCSWIEHFVICNESDKAIYIEYELHNAGSFPLFYDIPSAHTLNSSGSIDWQKDVNVHDEDDEPIKVRVALPPNSALVFGGLHNDTYKSYDQQFINSRVFNLKHLQILFNNNILEIIPSTFDQHFKKRQGQIRLVVK